MRILITLITFLGACTVLPPRDALITCHNGNCAHSDPKRDDTMEALHESLALEIDGRAVIDGIEIDLIWDPRTSRCVYEHDHIDADFAPETTVPVAAVAAHLRERRSAAAWNGETFVVKFELKPGAAPDQRDLSPAEMEALADCALARSDELQAAADDAGLALTVIYESENEVQLRALPERPAWCAERAGRHAARQLAVTQWRTARGMSVGSSARATDVVVKMRPRKSKGSRTIG